MTAQISDRLNFENELYFIEASDVIVDKKFLKLETPRYYCTACYRGFWCEFSIINNQICLTHLFVMESKSYPEIDGKLPIPFDTNEFVNDVQYPDIKLPLTYSGNIVLVREPMGEYYGGPHCFKYVFELTLTNGKIVEHIDLSHQIDNLRKTFTSRPYISKSERKSLQSLFKSKIL